MNDNTTRFDMKDVESRQIASIGYHEPTQTLAVRFKNWKGEVTSLYHYSNVTPSEYVVLLAADSKAGHFNKVIKPFPQKYPYKKIEDRPQPLAA